MPSPPPMPVASLLTVAITCLVNSYEQCSQCVELPWHLEEESLCHREWLAGYSTQKAALVIPGKNRGIAQQSRYDRSPLDEEDHRRRGDNAGRTVAKSTVESGSAASGSRTGRAVERFGPYGDDR